MMRYEVRCCCNAGKLLGWLHAPEGVNAWRFQLLPKRMPRLRLSDQRPSVSSIGPKSVVLKIDTYCPEGSIAGYKAIKDEGITHERLRRIFGFEDARC